MYMGIIKAHKPLVFILFETKEDDYRARHVTWLLGFDDFKALRPNRRKGGIWLFWKSSIELVNFSDTSQDFCHALFKLSLKHADPLITRVHAPCSVKRYAVCRSIVENLPPDSTPWMILGDRNEVCKQGKKMGGRPFSNSQGRGLNNLMDTTV